MNHYKLDARQGENESFLRAFVLLYLSSVDFRFDDERSTFFGKLPFSLDNVQHAGLTETISNSELANTIEGFDKPTVKEGDIVAAFYDTEAKIEASKKWYDDYIYFGLLEDHYLILGISNSSKSEFNDPFVNAAFKVIAHAKLAEDVQIENQL